MPPCGPWKLIKHKRAGNPIAVWEHNQVVWIPPVQIEIPDELAAKNASERPAT